jgi:hypothetical protein
MDSNRPKKCFIAQKIAETDQEKAWLRNWNEHVIAPAVREAGYEPVWTQQDSNQDDIYQTIERHLRNDEMSVFDLGGFRRGSPPSLNVIYELGVRRGLGLPYVIVGWMGQVVPYDIQNLQRIEEERSVATLDQNRRRLIEFIKSAETQPRQPAEAPPRAQSPAAPSKRKNVWMIYRGRFIAFVRNIWMA